MTEPTAICILALRSAGMDERARSGVALLDGLQLESGGFGVSAVDREGNWVSYAPLLAYQAFDVPERKRRLIEWMLGFHDASRGLSQEDVREIAERFHYDARIEGWPWSPNQVSWVEPTALFLSALLYAGVDPGVVRLRSAVRMLLDRKIARGGWNYGVPYDRGDMAPAPLPTSLGLLALVAAGLDEHVPAVEQAIRVLGDQPAASMSSAALAWALLALKNIPSARHLIPALAKGLEERAKTDGSIQENPFETALALLALGDFRLALPRRGVMP